MERGEHNPSLADLARPAAVLAQRFVQRWDVYPKQLDDGSYVCIRDSLNVDHLYAHLRGEITLGIYVLNQASQARFIVLDNDNENGWTKVVESGAKLGAEGIPAYLEKSRRGGHIWVFFKEPVAGSAARSFAQAIVGKLGLDGVEIFPKQDEVGDGPGSLIRMPFGVHRLTGRRYGFFGSDSEPLGRTLRLQISALQAPQFASEGRIKDLMTIPSPPVHRARPRRLREPTGHVSEKLKARMTVLEFVGKYVDLKPSKGGAVGLCPFHDDRHPSLGVNEADNYWHCFAGCGGGSIIDFWSLWRKKQGLDPGFTATIGDLAKILF